MSKTTLSTSEWASAGFKDFVSEEFISAPFTQIVNRALVSNSLKPAMGVERIHVRNLFALPREFGPNGEPVWETESKESRLRFAGNWITSSNTSGAFAVSNSSVNDFVEVTFYGTGLNLLTLYSASARDVRATVDGGSEGANFIPNSASPLNTRNYNPYSLLNVTSGLGAGWHTVKIRNAAAANDFFVSGFEILNDRSNVLIPTGSAFSGMKKQSLSTAVASTYNSSITGVKGGRVIKYLLDGAVSEAVQLVSASASTTLSNVDHSQEEIVRTIYYREFGAQRADDLSTNAAGTAQRAFTLDDGTATISTNGFHINGTISVDGGVIANTFFLTFTFVGTGLDVQMEEATLSAGRTESISIDGGASVGTIADFTTQPAIRVVKICSGLPYGTHVVKFTNLTGGDSKAFLNFYVYGPKKPTIPAGAIELADYNVMADYVPNTTGGLTTIAAGVLRKSPSREFYYNGTWGALGLDATNQLMGVYSVSNTNADFAQYTFFGTGFEYRWSQGTSSVTSQFTVDGLTNLTGFTTASYGSSVSSFTASTGTLVTNTTASSGNGVKISGLTLGLHTFKITKTGGTNMFIDCFDLVTPIHSHDKGFFKIGNLSLQDSRNTKPVPLAEKSVDLSKAKAWCYFDLNNTASVNHKFFNVSAILRTGTGQFMIFFNRPFKTSKYIVVASSTTISTTNSMACVQQDNQFPSYVLITVRSDAGTLQDAPGVMVACFGELENEDTQ